MPLARLAASVIRATLVGTLPETVTLKRLLAAATHLDWNAQRRVLGL